MFKKLQKKWDHKYYAKSWKNITHRNTWQNQRPLLNKEGAANGVAHALKPLNNFPPPGSSASR